MVLQLREQFQSWGAMNLHKYMEVLNIDIIVQKVGRMISELISEKKIKSYYSGTFAKERSPKAAKAPSVYATRLSDDYPEVLLSLRERFIKANLFRLKRCMSVQGRNVFYIKSTPRVCTETNMYRRV